MVKVWVKIIEIGCIKYKDAILNIYARVCVFEHMYDVRMDSDHKNINL